jgi:hypothetical protein
MENALKPFFSMMIICVGMQAFDVAAAQTHPLIDLRGFWIVNQTQSDRFEDKFKDTGRRPDTKFQFGLGGGRRGGGHRRSSGGPGVGSAAGDGGDEMLQQIIAAKALHIDGYGDVVLTYDGKVTRYLAPNPDGRVFSASG